VIADSVAQLKVQAHLQLEKEALPSSLPQHGFAVAPIFGLSACLNPRGIPNGDEVSLHWISKGNAFYGWPDRPD